MDEEANGAPGGYRNSMMSKVRSYRREFEKLRRDLVRKKVRSIFYINMAIDIELAKELVGFCPLSLLVK